MLAPGDLLSRKYILERFLGGGGFATVWAARNMEIDRVVAVKVLSDTYARDPAFVARFVREARIAARQIHESIVRVEDIGRTDRGVPFLIMELLRGRTLAAELKMRGALPLAEAIEIGCALLAGLAAAHARGVIHRDVKAANVFLSFAGSPGPRVRILDLGLAKDILVQEAMTQTDQMMGTPDYLAPELMLEGNFSTAGPRVDVFACGVVLFEMLTGKRPLDGVIAPGSTASRLIRQAAHHQSRAPLPGPSDVAAGVPAEVDALVRKALSLDAADRFPDAGAMLLALDRAGLASLGTRGTEIQAVRPAPRAGEPAAPPQVSELPTVHLGGGDHDPTTTVEEGPPAAVEPASAASWHEDTPTDAPTRPKASSGELEDDDEVTSTEVSGRPEALPPILPDETEETATEVSAPPPDLPDETEETATEVSTPPEPSESDFGGGGTAPGMPAPARPSRPSAEGARRPLARTQLGGWGLGGDEPAAGDAPRVAPASAPPASAAHQKDGAPRPEPAVDEDEPVELPRRRIWPWAVGAAAVVALAAGVGALLMRDRPRPGDAPQGVTRAPADPAPDEDRGGDATAPAGAGLAPTASAGQASEGDAAASAPPASADAAPDASPEEPILRAVEFPPSPPPRPGAGPRPRPHTRPSDGAAPRPPPPSHEYDEGISFDDVGRGSAGETPGRPPVAPEGARPDGR